MEDEKKRYLIEKSVWEDVLEEIERKTEVKS